MTMENQQFGDVSPTKNADVFGRVVPAKKNKKIFPENLDQILPGVGFVSLYVLSESGNFPYPTNLMISGQISIIPKPELRGFWGSSLIKPPFRVTSADVVIICPDDMEGFWDFDRTQSYEKSEGKLDS